MSNSDSKAWSEMWDRKHGVGALVRDDLGPRIRIWSDLESQSPARDSLGQTQTLVSAPKTRLGPTRRQRGSWKPPRGSQQRKSQRTISGATLRTQISAASLRERPQRQDASRSLQQEIRSTVQVAEKYAHRRGPSSSRGSPTVIQPLPADHPLMVEMAELKKTRKNRQLYWAGLIQTLGDEFENPAGYDSQMLEQEESLADEKFAELAGQIRMMEMGMSEHLVGSAPESFKEITARDLKKDVRSKKPVKPFHPASAGADNKRHHERRRGNGEPRHGQAFFRKRSKKVQGHHPDRRVKNSIKWTEERKDNAVSRWMGEMGIVMERSSETPDDRYMIDISSESDVEGVYNPIESEPPPDAATNDKPKGGQLAHGYDAGSLLDDDSKIEARTDLEKMERLGTACRLGRTPYGKADYESSVRSFAS